MNRKKNTAATDRLIEAVRGSYVCMCAKQSRVTVISVGIVPMMLAHRQGVSGYCLFPKRPERLQA
jgi:hypothetical protein